MKKSTQATHDISVNAKQGSRCTPRGNGSYAGQLPRLAIRASHQKGRCVEMRLLLSRCSTLHRSVEHGCELVDKIRGGRIANPQR